MELKQSTISLQISRLLLKSRSLRRTFDFCFNISYYKPLKSRLCIDRKVNSKGNLLNDAVSMSLIWAGRACETRNCRVGQGSSDVVVFLNSNDKDPKYIMYHVVYALHLLNPSPDQDISEVHHAFHTQATYPYHQPNTGLDPVHYPASSLDHRHRLP